MLSRGRNYYTDTLPLICAQAGHRQRLGSSITLEKEALLPGKDIRKEGVK